MTSLSARFTPSLLDRETLEQLFVGREHLLELAAGKITAAASGTGRSHLLFVGPRGAGKTHLVSLIYYRALDQPGYGRAFQVAWLPEDPWTIDSAPEFFDAIVANLEPEVSGRPGGVDGVIRAARAGGPIVVFVENLDQVLDQIGPAGQRALRALIENERALLLIATTTRLTRDLRSQAEPFYGFFDVIELPPFGVDAAVDMMQALARTSGDDALADKLSEPSSRAKLAAVEHLAGGQPRVWALLGAGLTIEGLDDLVTTLIERFDDLTPYYQEQLSRLSRNERRVVKVLADADRSLTVKMLAELTGIEQRSLGRTMTDLRRRGWVKPRTGYLMQFVDRRLTYYDLAEPLARLAFQLKEARGRPVRLVLDFLVAWFDGEALAAGSTSRYADAALARAGEPESELVRQLTHPMFIGTAGVDLSQVLDLRRRDVGASLVERIWQVDDALAVLQHRADSTALLTLPAGISGLLEQALQADGPPVRPAAARQRLRLGWPAIGVGVAESWAERAQDAADDGGSALGLVPLVAASAGSPSFRTNLDELWTLLDGSSGDGTRRGQVVGALQFALRLVGRADLAVAVLDDAQIRWPQDGAVESVRGILRSADGG